MRFSVGNSLAHKMTLLALLASSLASCVLMAAFLEMDSVTSHSQLENRMSSLANVIGQNSAAALDFDDRVAASEVLEALRAEPSIVSACLYGRAGALFAPYQRERGIHDCPDRQEQLNSADREFVAVSRTVSDHGDFAGTLFLQSDMREIRQRWQHLLLVAGGLLVLALLVGGVSGSILQKKLTKPIRELASAIHDVTELQNFAVRVMPPGRDEIGQLGRGFNGMLQELQRRAEEKKAFEARLEFQAQNDELTGLPNRRLLADRLEHAMARGRREGVPVALVYIDLDGFKLVNDSLGHSVGDLLLAQVADRLRKRVRESDTLARLGGDEFAVVLCGRNARDHAGVLAGGLLEALASKFVVESHEISIGASIGVSLFPEHGSTPTLLLQNADSAMYEAKRSSKGHIRFFSEELGAQVRERLNLETQLRFALAQGGIYLEYQPEFEVGTNRLVRFEALARWTHPTLGRIPPAKFIPIAEESSMIVALGSYVMESACREAKKWQNLSNEPIQVAVNVSSLQFLRETFVDEVAATLERTGLAPNLLQIELTESVMVSGIQRVTDAMTRLRNLGVSLAIDDFGTGYSCLSYLPKLPFQALKIDRSFVKEIGARPELEAMVNSLVMLAHDLGMRVIVEGVETREQLDLISALGGNEIQGFLLGRPTANPIAFLSKGREPSAKESRNDEDLLAYAG